MVKHLSDTEATGGSVPPAPTEQLRISEFEFRNSQLKQGYSLAAKALLLQRSNREFESLCPYKEKKEMETTLTKRKR